MNADYTYELVLLLNVSCIAWNRQQKEALASTHEIEFMHLKQNGTISIQMMHF